MIYPNLFKKSPTLKVLLPNWGVTIIQDVFQKSNQHKLPTQIPLLPNLATKNTDFSQIFGSFIIPTTSNLQTPRHSSAGNGQSPGWSWSKEAASPSGSSGSYHLQPWQPWKVTTTKIGGVHFSLNHDGRKGLCNENLKDKGASVIILDWIVYTCLSYFTKLH